MFAKSAIIFVFSTIWASCAIAGGLDRLTLVDPTNDSGRETTKPNLTWEPRVDGITRFLKILSPDGVQDAIKYGDTSALFYTSLLEDRGVKVVQPQPQKGSLSYTPAEITLNYGNSFNSNFSYEFGAIIDEASITPSLLLQHLKENGHLTLDRHKVFSTPDYSEIVWSRTNLVMDEKSEMLRSLGLGTNGIYAGIGMRFFDILGKNDAVGAVSYSDSEFLLSSQIERPFRTGQGYIKASTNLFSSNIELSIGIRFSLSNLLEVKMSSRSQEDLMLAPSLRKVRRASLPALWRSRVRISGE